jgi:hypothetical protein
MSIVKLKNLPKLTLLTLLRRRKKTLKQYMNELGIITYEELNIRCERMGIKAPSLEEFNDASPAVVSSPTEGIVVLEAPPIIHEQTGNVISEASEMTIDLGRRAKKKKADPVIDAELQEDEMFHATHEDNGEA